MLGTKLILTLSECIMVFCINHIRSIIPFDKALLTYKLCNIVLHFRIDYLSFRVRFLMLISNKLQKSVEKVACLKSWKQY